MADEEIPGQDYSTNGTTYRIPKLTDTADAVVAFEDYSNSIPFSEYIVAVPVTANTDVDDSYNGKMIVAQADVTLTFAADLTNGFSVACVADGEYTISYEGVDKENQQTQAYEVATVVTVNDRNIISVARAQSDNIIIDQGPAEGTPPAPVITNPDGGSVIYFTPGTPDSNQAPALLYSAKIKRQDDAELTTETVTVDQDNMEIAVTGTEPFVDYIVDVYGINEEGKGETASTSAFQLNYNEATGGTETIVDNYNGTGAKYKVHTFTSDDTFTVEAATNPFRVLVVGGGGGGAGGRYNSSQAGGGGGGGGYYENAAQALSVASYVVSVGASGAGRGSPDDGQPTTGGAGGTTSAFSVNCTGGGGGVTGGGGGGGGSPAGYSGSGHTGGSVSHHSSDISGSSTSYGGGGAGNSGGGAGSNGGGGSGGQTGSLGTGRNYSGGSGGAGVVIVAYQIGTSTTREIQQAEAESAARQAGVEEGLEQGIQEGYNQAQEELQEELTSLRTQLSAVGTTDV